MDVLFYILLALLVPAGYVLGVIGFFRANSAHTDLAALRRQVAELLARGTTASEAAVAAGAGAVEAPVLPRAPIAPEPVAPVPAAALPPEPVAPIAPTPTPQPRPSRDLEELLT